MVTTAAVAGVPTPPDRHPVAVVEAADGGVGLGLADQTEVRADRHRGRERGHAQRPGRRHQLASSHSPRLPDARPSAALSADRKRVKRM